MSALDALDKKIEILIVDDAPTMRKIIRNCLRELGFENCVEVPDGAAALEKLKVSNFRLVISDWNMPKMMGIDLLRAVRSDERLKSLPFLMVTAEAERGNVLDAARAGVSNYIVKPFTPEQLRAKLEAIFGGH